MYRAIGLAMLGGVFGGLLGGLLGMVGVSGEFRYFVAGAYLFPGPTLVLIGFITGWQIGMFWEQSWCSDNVALRARANGLLSIVLAVCGIIWAICIWGWVMIQPKNTFHEQGGIVVTLFVLPTTLVLWLAAGPIALVVGRRSIAQSNDSTLQRCQLLVAWTGYALGAVITVCGVLLMGYFVLCLVFA